MSKLTETEYEEYIRLLRTWVDAGRALEGAEDEVDPEPQESALRTREAVNHFRAAHGLDAEPAMAEGVSPRDLTQQPA